MKIAFTLVVSLWATSVLAQGFAPGVVNHRPTKEERTQPNRIKSESLCKSKSGKWYEEKGKYAYCVLAYADAGKVCKNSKDCIGHCIAKVPKVGEQQKTDHGTCQVDDSTDDCGRPQFEDGKVIYFNCD